MAVDDDGVGHTYSSSWSLVLPGGTPFDIGLVPSMAVENAYRDWARAAVARSGNTAAGSGTPSSDNAAGAADTQSMHSFFLPLTRQQADQLRQWALDESGTSSDGTAKSRDAAAVTTEQLIASATASSTIVLAKLMVDYSTGTGQLLLPVELLRGSATSGDRQESAVVAPTVGTAMTSSGFALLGDGTPLSLQRDGITVGPGTPSGDLFITSPASTSSTTATTTAATVTPSPSGAATSVTRTGRGRSKIVWSWSGAGRLHAYSNAVSKRIEEAYINYLCLLRNAATQSGLSSDGASGPTATPAVPHVSTISVRGQAYEMDFAAMTQRNPNTGRIRPIKREGAAPLLPVRVQDTTDSGDPASGNTRPPAARADVATSGDTPRPAVTSPQDLIKKMLPGKWQYMRTRGRKWFDFDAADNKGVEDAYQNFIVQFRSTAHHPDMGKTLGGAAASSNTAAVAATSVPKTADEGAAAPVKHITRCDIIDLRHRIDGTDKWSVVMNEHKEAFEAFLKQANNERATLVRLFYSPEKAQFVLGVAVWELLGDGVTDNVASLPGKGAGRLEETLRELGTDGEAAAEAFTEEISEAMCDVAAQGGGGIHNTATARRLLPNRGVVKGVTCGTENFTYTFDFIRMTETNEKTNRTRRIRRLTSAMPAVDGHYTATPPLAMSQTAAQDAAPSAKGDAAGAVKLPVDKHVPSLSEWEPVEVDGEFFYCMLNQANVTSNANKFYVIQLLRSKQSKKYSVYTRFGRVGDVGTPGFLSRDVALDLAVKQFKQQFQKKAHCKWEARTTATPKTGQYAYMKLDLSAAANDGDPKDAGKPNDAIRSAAFNPMVPANAPPSKLHPLVKDLMTYISDRSDMSSMMERDFSLDVKRMPLGNITKEQIKDALNVLSRIDDVLRNPLELNPQKQLTDLSNAFYTLVPHRVRKSERLPIIGDARALHRKVQLMQNLGDLEIASDLLKKVEDAGKNMVENPLDTMYRQLQCQMTPLDDEDPIVKRIRHYVEETRGKTHYNVPVVEQVFAVDRTGEDARYEGYLEEHKGEPGAPDTNRVMLWHGSRKTNYLGILSKGLRIAPPEAPSTGYMFGKGIYFSDVVTKASNYCFSNDKKGIILLNEVALGKCYELGKSEFMLKPHAGTFSTHGVGGSAPDTSGYEMHNGVLWPMGKTHEVKHPRIKKTSLLYPEYIIYSEAQYRMRYLLRIRFK